MVYSRMEILDTQDGIDRILEEIDRVFNPTNRFHALSTSFLEFYTKYLEEDYKDCDIYSSLYCLIYHEYILKFDKSKMPKVIVNRLQELIKNTHVLMEHQRINLDALSKTEVIDDKSVDESNEKYAMSSVVIRLFHRYFEVYKKQLSKKPEDKLYNAIFGK